MPTNKKKSLLAMAMESFQIPMGSNPHLSEYTLHDIQSTRWVMFYSDIFKRSTNVWMELEHRDI